MTVDVTEAGTGKVRAEVTHVGKSVVCDVTRSSNHGNWCVTFTPTEPGSYFLKAYFNDTEITGNVYLVILL